MSNALLYTVNELHHQIPYELLHAGFTIDEQPTTINLTSLDEKILRKCIKSRVLQDCNVVRGIETTIPLGNINPMHWEDYYTVYSIPPELTNNKEIISALSLSYLPSQFSQGPNSVNLGNNNMAGSNSFNSILNVASRIGSAASDVSVLTNAHLELVAYNTIVVYANYRLLSAYGIRVVVENDSDLQNISPRSYKNLSYLCVLAVKAYIYNKLSIAIGQGYLQAGQELGRFREFLDSYSDSEEQYRTYLQEVWKSIAFCNDVTAYNKFLRGMLSPGL